MSANQIPEFVDDEPPPEAPREGWTLVRIHVPELDVYKCLQFPIDKLLWDVKQQVLASLPKVSLFMPKNCLVDNFITRNKFLIHYDDTLGTREIILFYYFHRIFDISLYWTRMRKKYSNIRNPFKQTSHRRSSSSKFIDEKSGSESYGKRITQNGSSSRCLNTKKFHIYRKNII